MTFRVSANLDMATGFASQLTRSTFRVIDEEMQDAAAGLKAELRQQTSDALGSRMGMTWRSRFYQNDGDPRGPAAFVWSKAPRIISFFSADRVVTPLGRAFAIPVNPVIVRRGQRASVAEVEQRFGKLQAIRLKDGLVGLFATVIRAKSGRGLRQATKGRLRQGRASEKILMFVLVRSLRSRKLIDIEGLAKEWGARTANKIDRRLARELDS